MQTSRRLADWIYTRGVRRTARDLGVTHPCVFHWLSGANQPRIKYAHAIVKLAATEGTTLTLLDIYPVTES